MLLRVASSPPPFARFDLDLLGSTGFHSVQASGIDAILARKIPDAIQGKLVISGESGSDCPCLLFPSIPLPSPLPCPSPLSLLSQQARRRIQLIVVIIRRWQSCSCWDRVGGDRVILLDYAVALLNDAATHLASFGRRKRGGPKTASSIATWWAAVRHIDCFMMEHATDRCSSQLHKLRDYIQQALQKTYPGASGWTYTHELGFNVTPQSIDAWRLFTKAHTHFRPFSNKGWDLYQLVDDIVPTRAKGKYVFNAARSSRSQTVGELDMPVDMTQLSVGESQVSTDESQVFANESQLFSQSQLSDAASQSSGVSQPFSDWSQSNYGSQFPDSHDAFDGDMWPLDQLASLATSQLSAPPVTSQPSPPVFPVPSQYSLPPSTPLVLQTPRIQTLLLLAPAQLGGQSVLPGAQTVTPAAALKCAASDETDTPWSNKRTRTTGPDAIMFLGRGVMDIGGALQECFGTKSSGLFPTKKVSRARSLAVQDEQSGFISTDARLRLSLLFACDVASADAYVAENNSYSRSDLAQILVPDALF
ncbi:hypothetical protein C8R45DRAFT_1132325 [Mycena sanguinolenta]|nr:hypothetical protein C8R45DRAFT_1132325 [Mycena sanguinolenta]